MLSILYLFYNSNLFDALNNKDIDAIIVNYINDIAILVIKFLLKKNIIKLK